MMDPRDKRPSSDDLERNHQKEWIGSLVYNGYGYESRQHVDGTGKTAARLTQRERSVLRLIALGHPTKEIAERMCLSHHTVNNHRKKMLARSNCSSCAELVRIALSEDLL